ncbi:hypothetical protein ACFVGY_19795 [Streptomyces sp. NPDC127106]|uniref:hypothetical protein n=1 Tax=Streptomyces sp. NPDC127106 TaxID=3345360 RepID=UPI00362F1288
MEPGTNRPTDRDEANRTDVELTVRRQHDIPPAIRALGPADPDYIDVFTLLTHDASHRSPEQWARAAFEDVAGLPGQFIWRVLLGLRLQRRAAPDHLAGWKIADRCDRWIRLEAHSWMLTGHLVVQVGDEQVSMATILCYDRPMGARIWSLLSAVHRRLAPGLLRDAHRVQQPGPRR